MNYKYNRVSPSPNFKAIAKMIKSKYLIEEKLNNKINSISLTARNNLDYINLKKIKNNSIKKDDNIKSYTTKNIYISNNITNNNFYSISNGTKKNLKILIRRNIKNNEINKRNKDKFNLKEFNLDKLGNLSVNSKSRNQKMNKYIKSNNSKFDKAINNSLNNSQRNTLVNYRRRHCHVRGQNSVSFNFFWGADMTKKI